VYSTDLYKQSRSRTEVWYCTEVSYFRKYKYSVRAFEDTSEGTFVRSNKLYESTLFISKYLSIIPSYVYVYGSTEWSTFSTFVHDDVQAYAL